MKNKTLINEPIFNGERVSVTNYCQNLYQEKRVSNFLERSGANIIWKNEMNYNANPCKTCIKHRNGIKQGCSSFSLDSKMGCIRAPAEEEVFRFMSESDKILIVLSQGVFCGSWGFSSLDVIESLEDIALSVNRYNNVPIEYLKIVHSGKYVGRVYSAKREDFK